ncbi:MAG: hypothetical protein CVT49_13375 [candidate division Zixibacteria bacterium HGW-Zixibacteria-1]|nr:MAG: hypothetical protein CVT49_13375 [candidate division Zixibacteria bacterium HGW-Zixibacteria-1]
MNVTRATGGRRVKPDGLLRALPKKVGPDQKNPLTLKIKVLFSRADYDKGEMYRVWIIRNIRCQSIVIKERGKK